MDQSVLPSVQRNKKSYSGELMTKGTENEIIIQTWFQNLKEISHFLNVSNVGLFQEVDIDFIVVLRNGLIILLETKADYQIYEDCNLFAETHRINHHMKDPQKQLYTGWLYRSRADYLIVRNPNSNEIFSFSLHHLRLKIGKYIKERGKSLTYKTVETDDQKTTFGITVPMNYLKDCYKKFIFTGREPEDVPF